jgi:hypothetical protein
LGASIQAHFDAQIANGRAALLVLYRYDFQDGADALNVRGERQLGKLAAMLADGACPLIIEPQPGHPEISEARRLYVLARLSTLAGVPISEDRVVVAEPPASGFSGVEALLIDQTMLQQTRERGGEAVQGQARRSFGTGLNTQSSQ